MFQQYRKLSDTAKNRWWTVLLIVSLILLVSVVWSVQAHTTTATLTATAQVTAVPTPLVPTVIQHGMHTAVKELPPGVTVHTQQISPSHIRVTVTY
jgi:hypothetical protein